MKTLLLLSTLCIVLSSFGQTGILSARSKSLDATVQNIHNDNFGLPDDELDSIIYIGDQCFIQVIRRYGYGDLKRDTVCDSYIFKENNYDIDAIKSMYGNNVKFVGFEELKKERKKRKPQRNSIGWIALLLAGGIFISRKKMNRKLPTITAVFCIIIGGQTFAQTGVLALKSQGRELHTLNELDDTFGGPEIIPVFPVLKVISIEYLGNCKISMIREQQAVQNQYYTDSCKIPKKTLITDTIVGIYSFHATDFDYDAYKKNFHEDTKFSGFKQLEKERKKLFRQEKNKKNSNSLLLNGLIFLPLLSLKKKSSIA